ncbi:MAG: methylenetetrahydrofolate reductase [NAD(P)H] [Deltaproteobacteria bacterium]|nr:methylenetetrahydrofolate reductase [NAD(P)H] [Deltaproteobacteria bacterium]
MQLRQILQDSTRTLSFEIFPPKTAEGEKNLFVHLEKLQKFNPTFISVTMGAMGSETGKTFDIVERINKNLGTHGVAHLTCVSSAKDEILKSLEDLQRRNIRNILCLRGDPVQGSKTFIAPKNGFHHASELVAFVREQTKDYFSIGVAGYPEKHIEACSLEEDLDHLRSKVNAGADFIITQLFFDNADYFQFARLCRSKQITCRILPGLMPVTNYTQIQKFTGMCGAKIPKSTKKDLEEIQSNPQAVKSYGIQHATNQALELMGQSAPGLHFYILNQSESVEKICERVWY